MVRSNCAASWAMPSANWRANSESRLHASCCAYPAIVVRELRSSERQFRGDFLTHLLIVPDALNVGLVGEHKRRAHETRVFGQNRRGRHFEDMAFSIPCEVIHHQPSNR